jgi:hypothetical protein
MDRPPNSLDGHASAIGHLCIQWSRLEIGINSMLMRLMGIYGQEDNTAAELVTSNMNLHQKI